jgi:hypothetical protein
MAEEHIPGDHPDKPAEAPASPARGSHLQARAAGFLSRHPSLQKVLQWLGVYNPGGSINP